MTNIRSDLAKNIKKFRLERGFTQDELSDRAGIAYSTVAKLEQGAIKNPSLTTVVAIVEVLGMGISDLSSASDKEVKTEDEQVKFIYFDLNDVLIRFTGRVFTLLSHEAGWPVDKVENLFEHYNAVANRGKMSLDEVNKRLGGDLELKDLRWQDYYLKGVEPSKEIYKLIARLDGKVSIGILTNSMPGAVDLLGEKGLLPKTKITAIVDSSEVGCAKPERKIYEIAEKQAGFQGAQILFIDDRKQNLKAAGELGWQTFWYNSLRPARSLTRLEQKLTASGLL